MAWRCRRLNCLLMHFVCESVSKKLFNRFICEQCLLYVLTVEACLDGVGSWQTLRKSVCSHTLGFEADPLKNSELY